MLPTRRIRAFFAFASLVLPAWLAAQTLSVTYPTHHTLSPGMSQLRGSPNVSGPTVIHHPPVPDLAGSQPRPDGALQIAPGAAISTSPGASFDGMSVYDGGYIPSDNNIAVGSNHVVEVVNAAFAVYSKSGAQLLAPVPMKNLWTNLTGSACAANNGGDVVVQYDRAADRWLVTQLGSLSKPYSECVAVSQTNDPTGAYYLYAYGFGSNLNDYPKWSVWPTASNSAYLATYNLFANGSSFVGAEICAYDRAAMLAGAASPAALCYTGITGASFLPSDLDGATPPIDGTPAYFLSLYGSNLGLYALTPNFASGTASLSPFGQIGVAGYTQASSSPQPGTAKTLDALSDRLMYRLAFRMFPDHESMVVNHSVVAGGPQSGIRWYELRAPVSSSGAFTLYQQGTFAPDSRYRWMGSAAMDQAGNIAMGYSVSDGTSIYPSVRYTGRSPSDALGSMGTESSIIEGRGSQTGYSRWGDYSSLRIDPSDDCTFWYVNEYLPVTSSYGWYTRIGSFKFSGCGSTSPDFSMSASPASLSVLRESTGSSPIALTALNGYNKSVTLGTSATCPTSASCSLTPGSVTPTGSSTLSVGPSAGTPTGPYTVVVTATDGALTHSVNVPVSVYDTFTLTLASPSITVSRKSSSSISVGVTSGSGGALPVTLSASGLPRGVNASFSPNPVSNAASTLTISANRSATPGAYSLTITGTANGVSNSATLGLTIQ